MSLLSAAKRAAIASGLYRPARWALRQIRRAEQRALRDDIAFYRALLPTGALCFDVGANIGEKSEALLASGLQVVAFEPNPLVIPELLARCGHRAGWRLIRAGLGQCASIATLHARASHGQSSFVEAWDGGGSVLGRFDVPVLTLDQAIAKYGLPQYVKIDVEGWELSVLRGLSQRLPLISFEFHLSVENVRLTRACLDALSVLLGTGEIDASVSVNVTPAETSAFLFPEWMPFDRFRGWFPGDLDRTLPGPRYGDIFVRSRKGRDR